MARLRNITTIEGSGGLPPGTVVPFAGPSAPDGWLLCDGAEISRTTYADLYNTISTHHGAGNGSTTFNIPDIRQKFVIGKAVAGTASTLGTSGGSIDHSHSIPAHYHALGTGADLNITSSGTHATALDHTHSGFNSGAGTAHTHANTLATGAGTAHSHSVTGITLTTNATNLTVVSFSGSSGIQSNDHTHGVSATTGTESADHSHGFSGTTGGGNVMSYRLVHNVGAGTNFNHMVGYSGGVFTDVVDSNYLGSQHTHNYSGNTGGRSAAHTHSFSTTSGGISANHSHTINHGHSVSDPGHTHTVSGGTVGNESAHTHPITGAITNESAHTHPISIPSLVGDSGSTGAHTHGSGNFAGRIGLVTGGVDGNSVMSSGNSNPPFYVLNYIIKY